MVAALISEVLGSWSIQKFGLLGATVSLGYLTLVRLLRWRQYDAIHRKFASKFETMTPKEAQEIMAKAYLYDMPGLLNYALSFALFKTYAIPSVSRLLLKTRQLTTTEHVAKRYADTEIVIGTFMVCPISGLPRSENVTENGSEPVIEDCRAAISIARMNWLHAHYPITNDDYLYTLTLFILEPIAWTDRFGWRKLSPLECQAHHVFWLWVGEQMGIKDIPESLDEVRKWSTAYEEQMMVPDPTNRDVSSFTTEEFLYGIPEAMGLKSLFRNLSICLLEDRVRLAMMQPEQPRYLHAIANSVFLCTAFCHRYLSLPRWEESSVIPIKMPGPSKDGTPVRIHPTVWKSKPWYKPESKGIGGLLDRVAVKLGLYEDLPGPKYRSEGYRLEETGPLSFEHSGQEAVMKMAAEIHGCPIVGPLAMRK